jgi:uridine kinase
MVLTRSLDFPSIRLLLLDFDAPYPVRVAIDGFCAAGKTTLADALAVELRAQGRVVIRASADDFQNPPEIRWQLGRRSPEGFFRHTIDFRALRSELLEPLGPEGSLRYRTSTYDIHALRPNVSPEYLATPSAILLLDGLFLHVPQLAGCFDFTVFVSTANETCIARARTRRQEHLADADEIEALYRERYVPGFELYIAEVHPETRASVVFST